MKKLLFLFFFASISFAQQIPGTTVGAEITTGDSSNAFSIGNTNFMQGGLHSVADTNARNLITTARRTRGMLCWVWSDSTMYQLKNGITNSNWKVFNADSVRVSHYADSTGVSYRTYYGDNVSFGKLLFRDTTKSICFDTTNTIRRRNYLQAQLQQVTKILTPDSLIASVNIVTAVLDSIATENGKSLVTKLGNRLLGVHTDIENRNVKDVSDCVTEKYSFLRSDNSSEADLHDLIDKVNEGGYIYSGEDYCADDTVYYSFNMEDTIALNGGGYFGNLEVRVRYMSGNAFTVRTMEGSTIKRNDILPACGSWKDTTFSYSRNSIGNLNNLKYAILGTGPGSAGENITVDYFLVTLPVPTTSAYFTTSFTNPLLITGGYYENDTIKVRILAKSNVGGTMKVVRYSQTNLRDSSTFSSVATTFTWYTYSFVRGDTFYQDIEKLRIRIERVSGLDTARLWVDKIYVELKPMNITHLLPAVGGVLAESSQVADTTVALRTSVGEGFDSLGVHRTNIASLFDTQGEIQNQVESKQDYGDTSTYDATRAYVRQMMIDTSAVLPHNNAVDSSKIKDGSIVISDMKDTTSVDRNVRALVVTQLSNGKIDSSLIPYSQFAQSGLSNLNSGTHTDTLAMYSSTENKLKASPVKKVNDSTVSVKKIQTNGVVFGQKMDTNSVENGEVYIPPDSNDLVVRFGQKRYSLITGNSVRTIIINDGGGVRGTTTKASILGNQKNANFIAKSAARMRADNVFSTLDSLNTLDSIVFFFYASGTVQYTNVLMVENDVDDWTTKKKYNQYHRGEISYHIMYGEKPANNSTENLVQKLKSYQVEMPTDYELKSPGAYKHLLPYKFFYPGFDTLRYVSEYVKNIARDSIRTREWEIGVKFGFIKTVTIGGAKNGYKWNILDGSKIVYSDFEELNDTLRLNTTTSMIPEFIGSRKSLSFLLDQENYLSVAISGEGNKYGTIYATVDTMIFKILDTLDGGTVRTDTNGTPGAGVSGAVRYAENLVSSDGDIFPPSETPVAGAVVVADSNGKVDSWITVKKVYRALIDQHSENDPTELHIFENGNVGTATWTRLGVGQYQVTFDAVISGNRDNTFVLLTNARRCGDCSNDELRVYQANVGDGKIIIYAENEKKDRVDENSFYMEIVEY